VRPPDPAFSDPRLAVLYDVLEDGRPDLDVYAALTAELGAHRVVDVGCGTGSLALLLASRGLDVTGVDPAGASLDLARAKPGAEDVRWIHGDATAVPEGLGADLVVMTGNVAQVFVDDADWSATLDAVRRCLRPSGWLVFETRRPEARAWEDWDVEEDTLQVPGHGTVTFRRRVTEVAPPLVTFEAVATIGGEEIPSVSVLRFRERAELERDLAHHGLETVEVREAPDRPGLEMVVLARRTS